MRVLLLNQFYPPDVAATGQLLADVAEALVRRGHEVHVLCSRRAYGGGGFFKKGKNFKKPFPAESCRNGVFVHRLAATGFGRSGVLGRIVDYLSFYVLAVGRAMHLPPMDVCVSLTTPPFIALVGGLLQQRRRTKLVLWTMDLYPEIAVAFGAIARDGLPHRILRRIARRVYGAADGVISLGETMSDLLVKAGVPPERITTVHNWVPGETVEYHEPLANDVVTLLYSGNLGLGHELETAVRALASLSDRSKLRVRFVGYGKLRARLQAMVRDVNLTCVEFAPPCSLGALSASLATGEIHLVSQRPGTRGLLVPSKIYGILAAGRAVLYIGPDDTEVAGIVRHAEVGRVVPPGDVEAAAMAIRELLADGEGRRRMGDNARRYYETHFGRTRSVERILDVMEAVGHKPLETKI